MYRLFIFKRMLEDLIMYPLILVGRLIAWIKPLSKEFDFYFFFPFYSIGGAEKVHAQIVQAVANENCIIFFTKRSSNNLFLNTFMKTGCKVFDISKYTDNKGLYFLNIIYRGIISGYINSQNKKPVVFNGQCNFGYKISPWIKKSVMQVELIHSFNSFSIIRIPFISFYHTTVMISQQTIADHIQQYKRLSIPIQYSTRIRFILNGISLPDDKRNFVSEDQFTVLYAGRGTTEKRVHLVAAIAQRLLKEILPIKFLFMGDVKDAIPMTLQSGLEFLGNQNDPKAIQNIYRSSDVLILTSVFEGFPMVVMEGMANGLAIVSTDVGDLSKHIKDGINGFLIKSKHEAQIVEDGASLIKKLYSDKALLQTISETNMQYAYRHFGIDQFNHTYQELFKNLMQHHE
jgi:L-malate glycosyltransferase